MLLLCILHLTTNEQCRPSELMLLSADLQQQMVSSVENKAGLCSSGNINSLPEFLYQNVTRFSLYYIVFIDLSSSP